MVGRDGIDVEKSQGLRIVDPHWDRIVVQQIAKRRFAFLRLFDVDRNALDRMLEFADFGGEGARLTAQFASGDRRKQTYAQQSHADPGYGGRHYRRRERERGNLSRRVRDDSHCRHSGEMQGDNRQGEQDGASEQVQLGVAHRRHESGASRHGDADDDRSDYEIGGPFDAAGNLDSQHAKIMHGGYADAQDDAAR